MKPSDLCTFPDSQYYSLQLATRIVTPVISMYLKTNNNN